MSKLSLTGFLTSALRALVSMTLFYKVGKKSDIKEYFLREFQPMTSVFDDSYLLLEQDTNRFLV